MLTINLIEILNRYGVKSTFNICSKFIGEEGRLTLPEIKRYILDFAHEVAVHGENHIAPGIGKPELVISDILNCRNTLEKNLNSIIRGMAYPDSGIMSMHNGNKADEIKMDCKEELYCEDEKPLDRVVSKYSYTSILQFKHEYSP